MYGLKPPFFEEFQGGFRVTVYSNSEEMTNSELGEKLSKTQQLIIEAMRGHRKISQTELARMLGISETAVQNNTKYLQENGFILRVGPAKGGHWEVL